MAARDAWQPDANSPRGGIDDKGPLGEKWRSRKLAARRVGECIWLGHACVVALTATPDSRFKITLGDDAFQGIGANSMKCPRRRGRAAANSGESPSPTRAERTPTNIQVKRTSGINWRRRRTADGSERV